MCCMRRKRHEKRTKYRAGRLRGACGADFAAHLAVLAASCVLAFCPTSAGAAITAAGMALTWAVGAAVRRIGGEWGDGDSLMLGCVLGATAGTPTVLTLVPALGAASLLFIACSHRIGVKTGAMPLAPVISLALIASLAAGATS